MEEFPFRDQCIEIKAAAAVASKMDALADTSLHRTFKAAVVVVFQPRDWLEKKAFTVMASKMASKYASMKIPIRVEPWEPDSRPEWQCALLKMAEFDKHGIGEFDLKKSPAVEDASGWSVSLHQDDTLSSEMDVL